MIKALRARVIKKATTMARPPHLGIELVCTLRSPGTSRAPNLSPSLPARGVSTRERISEISRNEILEITGLTFESLQDFILVTGHRRENFGKGLQAICAALLELSSYFNIIFPVHLNPNVRREVNNLLQEKDNIHLIDPVSYPIMLWLIKYSEFIISDSGGIQEEAPSFGKKVLVTREFSERMEGVDSEFAVLVGSNTDRIVAESKKILQTPFNSRAINPYGDGHASKKIVNFLKENLG